MRVILPVLDALKCRCKSYMTIVQDWDNWMQQPDHCTVNVLFLYQNLGKKEPSLDTEHSDPASYGRTADIKMSI